MAGAENEPSRLPLRALLSQVLVAFTIECDNEFERQMPHRTSNYGNTAGRGAGPWLVSMAMWWTCMRFAGEDAITGLRESLQVIAAQLDPALPDCLPILGYGRPARLPHYRWCCTAAVSPTAAR